MVDVLFVSDLHVPDRYREFPVWLKRFLEDKSGDIDLAVLLGDITSRMVLEELSAFLPVFAVRGNTDYLKLPDKLLLELDGVSVGAVHGTEVRPRGDKEQLWEYGKALGAQILGNGHTHVFSVYQYKGIVFINPGTATGVISGQGVRQPKTLALAKINEGEVLVRKVEEYQDSWKEKEEWRFKLNP